MTLDEIDKTGLIRESYRIEGIDAAQCRTIFLDWLLKLPAEIEQIAAIEILLAAYAREAPEHPMSAVLREALQAPERRGRRGGASGRRSKAEGDI